MTTALDTKIRPKVTAVLAAYGTNLAFSVPGTETYDPATGITTEGSVTTPTVKGTPPAPYEKRYVDGDVVKVEDAMTLVSAEDVAAASFTPAQGQTVTFDSVSWDVVSVKVHRSGDQVAAYELQLRR